MKDQRHAVLTERYEPTMWLLSDRLTPPDWETPVNTTTGPPGNTEPDPDGSPCKWLTDSNFS